MPFPYRLSLLVSSHVICIITATDKAYLGFASAHDTNLGLNNSPRHSQTHPIIVNYHLFKKFWSFD